MVEDRVIERAVEDALARAPGSNALLFAKIDFQ